MHTLQHKGNFNDVQAHLRQFHLEVEQGRGAIPIDLETPTNVRNGACIHQAGDVEIRIK